VGDSFHVGLMVDVCRHGEVTNFTTSAPNGLASPHTTIKYTPAGGEMMVYVCAMIGQGHCRAWVGAAAMVHPFFVLATRT
jgi:hypothetical protein